MKKKILLITLVAILLFVTGCTKKENKDALAFKESYESKNGTENKKGVIYRTISIDKDNPFVKVSAEEIVEKIENRETFFVYFGDPKCPWCRSVIEKFISVAKDYNISKVYYVEIWDEEGNEILRSKYELDSKNKKKVLVEGTESYKKLLTYFDEYLSEYTLTTSEGKTVDMNEKRMFAPSFLYIKDGKAVGMTTGISSKQSSSTSELTEEILKDEEKLIKDLFDLSLSCNNQGC